MMSRHEYKRLKVNCTFTINQKNDVKADFRFLDVLSEVNFFREQQAAGLTGETSPRR